MQFFKTFSGRGHGNDGKVWVLNRKTGERAFLTTVIWNRLGMARDRVFKLQWSAPVKTALNGAPCI